LNKIVLILTLSAMAFAYDENFKENIHQNIVDKLPKILCEEKQVFRKCYAVSELECKQLVSVTAESCWRTLEGQITEDKTIDELGAIGNQIGQCAGAIYDMSLQKAKKADLECLKDPNWLK